MTRDEVLQEFAMWTGHPNPPRPLQTYWYNPESMADEIVRLRTERDDLRDMVNATQWGETVASAELEQLRRILAALREPSEAVIVAAEDAMDTASATDCVPGDWNTAWVLEAIRAAVAAAEQEVSHESR